MTDNFQYWLAFDAGTSSSNYWIIGSQTNNGYGNGVGMSSASWNATTPVWSDAGRDYAFKVWTGGVTTSMSNTHVMGAAHVNTITGSAIDKDAYYQTLTTSTVTGTKHPGSADPGPQDFPISPGQIADLEAAAVMGGTHVGDVVIDGSSATLGPEKIVGNLSVQNGAVLTMTGTLYVTGNLTVVNNATIQLHPDYGANSGGFVVDGTITILNGVVFRGSGTYGSYVILDTNSPSLDVNNPAMLLNNNSQNSIFYAPNGVARFDNNSNVKEVTAFTLFLNNGSHVTYETGLANVNFSTGPGGSWLFMPGTKRETHN